MSGVCYAIVVVFVVMLPSFSQCRSAHNLRLGHPRSDQSRCRCLYRSRRPSHRRAHPWSGQACNRRLSSSRRSSPCRGHPQSDRACSRRLHCRRPPSHRRFRRWRLRRRSPRRRWESCPRSG
ncbi:hypothetical protein HDK64DRAFT_279115 [Phyllosticta capitalensis]